MNSLINPEDMPQLQGLRAPREFYWILGSPAPLAGMSFPTSYTPWAKIKALGFQHVVCLTETNPNYDPAPLLIIHAVKLKDLVGGGMPTNPEEEQLIREAVRVVRDRLVAGAGVVIHCQGGTGRTGTVIGCFLRTLGYSYAEVSDYLKTLNRVRGKGAGWPELSGWPESFWQAQLVERFQCNE